MSPESFPVSAEFDKPREKCGVFGIVSSDHMAAREVYRGLEQLEHRGEDAAGIAVWNGESLMVNGDKGGLNEVFDQANLDTLMGGKIGIGHTRYATAGKERAPVQYQPLYRDIESANYSFAIGHNGNLTALQDREIGYSNDDSDTELLADLLEEDIEKNQETVYEALKRVLPDVQGAYSLVVMDQDRLIGVRDPNGFRPLLLGVRGSGEWCLSSESGAIKTIGAQLVREIEPGEIVVIEGGTAWSDSIKTPETKETFCINEFVYFAREDQMWKGESVLTRRMRMGRELAKEAPVDADVVIGVPGTAIPIARGYAAETGIPEEQGIIKLSKAGRTFIQKDQLSRKHEAQRKLHPVPDIIRDKRLVLVEDSIVRGTVTSALMGMLWKEGAKEIHVRIASPPYLHGCHYGMDTGREDLLIAKNKTVEEIRQHIGVNSLHYLSLSRLKQATSPESDYFCDACFTGNYPTPVPVKLGRAASRTHK